MKKISILLPDLRSGGVERIRLVLATEFSELGYDVEFVLMQAKGELIDEAQSMFSVVDLGATRVRQVPVKLAGYLQKNRPSALLVAMWPLTVIAPIVARFPGCKCLVLVSEHCSLGLQYREWGYVHRLMLRSSMALGYRFADARVGVSAGVVRELAFLSGLNLEAFNVIHNPAPPRAGPSDEAIKDAEALWAVPPGGRVVTVGTMKAEKNHPLLLHAFSRLDRPYARLMLVGDGAERNALVSLVDELDIADKVIFIGFQADPTVFYQTADLFVLASDYEGFGNVIVEAMACGTPVVSTDCPSGPAEILDGGRYGRLVPVGNVEAMAGAIAESLDRPLSEEQLKARASSFDPAKAAAAYLKLLSLTP